MGKIMKWVIAILALGLVVSFFAGSTEPKNKYASTGVKAIEIADKYLDGKIGYSAALNTLERYQNDIKDDGEMKSRLMRAYIGQISTAIFMDFQSGQSGSTVLVARNELAQYLDKPLRNK